MAVVERPSKTARGGIVYWVATSWTGGVAWERSGTSRRDAERLDAQRKREVKAGDFLPRAKSGGVTLEVFAQQWLARRTNRTADNDRQRIRDHVLSRPWAAGCRMRDWELAHSMRLVEELQAELGPARQKTTRNIWTAMRTLLRDAIIAGHVVAPNAVTLPKGHLRDAPQNQRAPYPVESVRRLVSDERISWNLRVLWAILFYTGAREGEGIGLRWADWDETPEPLGALSITKQYGGAPLKTDEHRVVPVHPHLEEMLRRWRDEGWDLFGGRAPTSNDFIVPADTARAKHPHFIRRAAYAAWRRSLETVGVPNQTLHATRNTFVSWARRGGARPDVLERITHNAKGTMLDRYTTWDWAPLCEAVMCLPFDAPFDHERIPAAETRQPRGLCPAALACILGDPGEWMGASCAPRAPDRPAFSAEAADFGAHQSGELAEAYRAVMARREAA